METSAISKIDLWLNGLVARLVHKHGNGFCARNSSMTTTSFLEHPPEQIVKYPDDILRKVCTPVAEINDDIRKVCRIMFDLMYKFRGWGLAAPQVGLDLQIFVVNQTDAPATEKVFINSDIFFYGPRTTTFVEGCLSLPGCSGPIDRPHKIMMKHLDENGKNHKVAYEGMMSRIVQHEFDHTQGKLITDLMSTPSFDKIRPVLAQLEANARQERRASA